MARSWKSITDGLEAWGVPGRTFTSKRLPATVKKKTAPSTAAERLPFPDAGDVQPLGENRSLGAVRRKPADFASAQGVRLIRLLRGSCGSCLGSPLNREKWITETAGRRAGKAPADVHLPPERRFVLDA